MVIIDIILILDLLLLTLAGLLFLASRLMAGKVTRRVSGLIKWLLAGALISYIGAEMFIGQGANLVWGILLVAAIAVILYFANRKKQAGS